MLITKAYPAQQKFIDRVLLGKERIFIWGGSIRAAKTVGSLMTFAILCKIFPGSRWVVFRRDFPTLKLTTVPSWERIKPPNLFPREINKASFIDKASNGSEIIFMSENFERDTELNRLKGLEVNGALLEQVEELRQDTFNMIRQRVGQWKIDPMPPGVILANLNPSEGWVKEKFYTPYIEGTLPKYIYFQEAFIDDNLGLDAGYKEDLKDLPPELYARFVANKWSGIDHINQLIPWIDIDACSGTLENQNKIRSLGGDIGRMGNDQTVFYVMEGFNIIHRERHPKTKTYECVERAKKLMAEFSIESERTVIDSVGIGAGVVDQLEQDGFNVIPMVGGASSICKDKRIGTRFKFANWKAWNYWIAAELIKKHSIGNFNDNRLRSDAGAVFYFINREKEIQVESKDILRKRIGRSCDDFDAFCYAVWGQVHDTLIPKSGIYTSKQLAEDLAREQKELEKISESNK